MWFETNGRPPTQECRLATLQRPHARQVQMDLFYDYRTNVALYPKWQAFLREREPENVIFWAQDDIFSTREGGEAYLRELPKAQMHRLETIRPSGCFFLRLGAHWVDWSIRVFACSANHRLFSRSPCPISMAEAKERPGNWEVTGVFMRPFAREIFFLTWQ
jgi:hypothetical protein